MSILDDLFTRALELPAPDRMALAHRLLRTINPRAADADADYEEAWVAEAEARLERLEQGKASTREWSELMAEIEASLARGRAS